MTTSRYGKKGYILICLMMAVILATIFASVLYASVYLSSTIFINQQKLKAAYYTAAAGVEYGVFIIKNSSTYNPLNQTTWPKPANQGNPFYPFGQVNGSSVVLNVTQGGGAGTDYTMVSTGTALGQTKTITVTTSSEGVIKSWQ
jgi:Tfp pilus assembly protein PilX